MKFVNTLKAICSSIKDDTNDTVTLRELADVATSAVLELETELDNCHEVLNALYESGIKLDEHENPVREALGLSKI